MVSNAYFTPPGLAPEAYGAARDFVAASHAAKDASLVGLKLSIGTNLFLWHLDGFAGKDDPTAALVEKFRDAAAMLRGAASAKWNIAAFDAPPVAQETVGVIYSNAWSLLTREDYFEHTFERFLARFQANGIDPKELFRGKVVLDAGCGCGNYAAAIARCGAERVIALDVGEEGLEFGRRMIADSPYRDRIEFGHGSAAQLPLTDRMVDFVWSNSVVHVTGQYEDCLHEAARVLRPGGMYFVYVDGKFGLFELLVNALREAFADVPQPLFHHFLQTLGINPGRITWMAANFYVPYERRPQVEVEALLRGVGFAELRQLRRGVDIDQIEQVSTGQPHAAVKYGEAQLKYLCVKRG